MSNALKKWNSKTKKYIYIYSNNMKNDIVWLKNKTKQPIFLKIKTKSQDM